MARTRSASAKANGPGAPGVGGGGGRQVLRRGRSGTVISGFSASARQQTKASRPPGFRAPRRLAKAAGGSAKNITPKREKTASKLAGSKA